MKKFETIQEAADYAVLKTVEQGGMCISQDGVCAYKRDVNAKVTHCAIGYLVCDSENLQVVGSIKYAVEEFYNSVNYELIVTNLIFFDCLQCFHDTNSKAERKEMLDRLSVYIDTSKPQYKQWVEMV